MFSRSLKLLSYLMLAATLMVSSSCSSNDNDHGSKGTGHSEPMAKTDDGAGARSHTMGGGANSGMSGGMVWKSMAFPTGDRATSAVELKKMAPAEVTLGQPFSYEIEVTNLTNAVLDDVVVSDDVTSGMDIIKSMPEGAASGNMRKWVLGSLKPGEKRTIKIDAVAKDLGSIKYCSTVTYNQSVCVETQVTQPKLQIRKEGPAEVLLCDPIIYKVTVSNNGTGPARGVRVSDALPAGLVTLDGNRNTVDIDAGDLGAGQSKSFDIRVKAERAGEFSNTAKAMAAGGLTSESAPVKTIVRAPALAITKNGPDKAISGRQITYQITVENKGDGVARDTVIEDAIPAGTSFVSATDGGVNSGGMIKWMLGAMNPGAKKTVGLTVRVETQGVVKNTATAKAYCAKDVQSSVQTTSRGIPAVLLEVVDLEDPILVGENVTYVITATNQGFATDTNVKIVATLEGDTMGYVSGSGATQPSVAGTVITFAPLAKLDPKQRAEWRLVVKAKKAGDVRLKISMTTDKDVRSIDETESTNFYE